MHALLRTFLVVVLVGLAALSVFIFHDACSQRDWLRESRRREELQGREEISWRHRNSLYQAIQTWLDRRWTLRETLSRFQELEQEELAQDWPSLRGILRESLLKSGEERYCRVIQAHLPVILHDRPQELTAALRRLEK
jgi:hypothetical protein